MRIVLGNQTRWTTTRYDLVVWGVLTEICRHTGNDGVVGFPHGGFPYASDWPSLGGLRVCFFFRFYAIRDQEFSAKRGGQCNAARPRLVYSRISQPPSLLYIYYRGEDLPPVATILPTHHTVPYSTPRLFSHIPFLS